MISGRKGARITMWKRRKSILLTCLRKRWVSHPESKTIPVREAMIQKLVRQAKKKKMLGLTVQDFLWTSIIVRRNRATPRLSYQGQIQPIKMLNISKINQLMNSPKKLQSRRFPVYFQKSRRNSKKTNWSMKCMRLWKCMGKNSWKLQKKGKILSSD